MGDGGGSRPRWRRLLPPSGRLRFKPADVPRRDGRQRRRQLL